MFDQSFTSNVLDKPSKRLEKVLKQTAKDIEKGDNLSPLFIDMEKMDFYLDSI